MQVHGRNGMAQLDHSHTSVWVAITQLDCNAAASLWWRSLGCGALARYAMPQKGRGPNKGQVATSSLWGSWPWSHQPHSEP